MSFTRMASRLMKAARISQFGGPEVIKYCEDVPVPTPKGNEVLIKVHSAGVNPVDTYVRAGTYAKLPTLPFTPGNDLAGVVDSVGPNVTKVKPGDRVFTLRTLSGGYAEFALAGEAETFTLPEQLDFYQGAALPVPYFTAYRAVHSRGNVQSGETVLIHGASGAVGIAACQIARAAGCKVLGTAGTERGLNVVLENGAHHVFDHTKETYTTEIMAATDGRGPDMIVEMLANENLQRDLEMLAPRGRVIVVGNRSNIEINPRLTMQKETDIRGVLLFMAPEGEFNMIHAAVCRGAKEGWLRPCVGQKFTLEQAGEAQIEVIEHKTGTAGKIVLDIQ